MHALLDEDAEFWKPCYDGHQYVTLTPGDDDCCRVCPNTDAEELIPCACAILGPITAAYAVRVVNPLDKTVVTRDDDPAVPTEQRNRQVFPNCCHPAAEAIWVYKHAWRGWSLL